ncbi:Hypothetical protein SRAE_2000466400 [Strongyloides ratti]|uniref:Uncharacterized protein n=1 Tax=Strongyloides ratti TaxID=34506 RepID=A0A090LJL4_STRRB|nr:Hypothetical protein SRAE_2000466400 [Strongyloides ratti]CEF70022.1 Hypothetical protein SRAE_2000466400 [Strongyloides ratti]
MKYFYYTLLGYLKNLGRRFRKVLESNFFTKKYDEFGENIEFSYQSLDSEPLRNIPSRNGGGDPNARTVTIQGITFKGGVIDTSLLVD